jgi:CheY-like chemotaxis protein
MRFLKRQWVREGREAKVGIGSHLGNKGGAIGSQMPGAAAAVLSRLIAQCDEYGAARVLLQFSYLDSVPYTIYCRDGQSGHGLIAGEIRQNLRQLLFDLHSGREDRGFKGKLRRVRFHSRVKGEEVEVFLAENAPDVAEEVVATGESLSTEGAEEVLQPRQEVVEKAPQPRQEVVEEKRLQSFEQCKDRVGGHVLIVDDNEVFRRVLQGFLERQGLTVLHAASGEEAFELVEERSAEIFLVISDVHMVDGDGRNLILRLRALEKSRSVSIVMLTSDEQVELRVELFKIGADACFLKSEDPRLLCAYIERIAAQLFQKRAA